MIDFTSTQILLAAVVVLMACAVRGMSGFGAGLVAIPLLVFVVPIYTAVPLMALLIFLLFVFLTIRDRNKVHWREFRSLAIPTVVGVVAGLLLFKTLESRLLLALLGLFLIVYATYLLVVPLFRLPQLRCSEQWALPAGFAGAFIDTLFGGGGGTLVVIYVHARGIDKMAFRATVAAVWFVEMIARITGYALAGYYTRDVLLLVALMVPLVWLGTWLGERIGDRIDQDTFSRVLAMMLMLSGISQLLK